MIPDRAQNFAATARSAALVTSSASASASMPSLRNLLAASAASRSVRALTITVTPCWAQLPCRLKTDSAIGTSD